MTSRNRIATHGQSRYPQLWRGCVGAWAPCLGPTGLSLRDWSGRGNHGTLTNMLADSDWVVNGGAYTLDFDGSNDLVRIASPPYAQTSYFSACCFVRSTTTPQSGKQIFGRYETVSPANNRSWQITTASTAWGTDGIPDGNEFAVTVTSDGISNAKQYWVNVNILDGNWHHIGFSFAPNDLRLFLDGIERTTQKQANLTVNSLFSTSEPTQIGAVNATPAAAFLGQIDDNRVYDRVLKPSEFALLACRRGIAYELEPRHRYKAASAATNRRRRILLGNR